MLLMNYYFKGLQFLELEKTSNQSLNIDNKNYFDLTNNEHDDFVDVYLGANCYICITTPQVLTQHLMF